MVIRVDEPLLGPEVVKLLEGSLGLPIIQQGTTTGRKRFDFYFEIDGDRIVGELKIGGLQKLLEGIAQAEDYRDSMGASGVIVLVYPEEARKKVINRPEDIQEVAMVLRPAVMVLTPFLKQHYAEIGLAEIAQVLRESLARPAPAPSVELLVVALRQAVQGIALEIRRSARMDSAVVQETVASFDLFKVLVQGEGGEQAATLDEDALKSAVADLAAYILVNQLLLYHILCGVLSLPALRGVSAPAELKPYFKRVTDVDYEAVYCINIASTIPYACLPEINLAIQAIRALQPQKVRHDLLGRMLHQFLPFDTRKLLGAFYTRPQAAEILAGLAIRRREESVLDPACGSGTLLVAAYRRKGRLGKARSHKLMVENELTGVDIMPFAAHLAALNLTLQSPGEVTNTTRIGTGNSLHLALGQEVSNVAQWMREFGREVTGLQVEQRAAFKVRSIDTVIMNPPFTKKETLTLDMKGVGLNVFGEQNYWAYFVALADSLLKKGGRIAAVLPRDFFRGEYSRTVRRHLFEGGRYTLRYVLKTTKDFAFSERAYFRDFLVVLEKGATPDKCAQIYIKKRLDDLGLQDATSIADRVAQVEEGRRYEDDDVLVLWRDQDHIRTNWHDLGDLVVFNTDAGEFLLDFHRQAVARGRDKLVALGKATPHVPVRRGITPWVVNLLNFLFVVRPLTSKRTQRSRLILEEVGEAGIRARVKDTNLTFSVPSSSVRKGLKTAGSGSF